MLQLVDLRPRGRLPLPGYHNLHRFVVLDDGRVLAADAGHDVIVALDPTGDVRDWFGAEDLVELLRPLVELPEDVAATRVLEATRLPVGS